MSKNKNWEKSEIESFSKDVIKYRKFKNELKKPNDFNDEDEAISYYYKKIDVLSALCNRSLEMLLNEKTMVQFPSEEAEIATLLVSYIEEVQGI